MDAFDDTSLALMKFGVGQPVPRKEDPTLLRGEGRYTDDVSLPGVVEYRMLMDKYNPAVPASLKEEKYTPQRYSFISLEGYINAKVVVEALRRAGPNPTRVGFRQALESFKNFDLGIGAPLSFGPERHQGLDNVYFTRVEGERWVPIADWSSAVQA